MHKRGGRAICIITFKLSSRFAGKICHGVVFVKSTECSAHDVHQIQMRRLEVARSKVSNLDAAWATMGNHQGPARSSQCVVESEARCTRTATENTVVKTPHPQIG